MYDPHLAPRVRVASTARSTRLTRIAAGLLALACHPSHVPLAVSVSAADDTSGLVARGEYIVRNVAVCGECHAADPRRDSNGPLSGGLAFHDWRLGTVRAANLSSDSATGLGAWSEAEIIRAIRNGQSRDGRLLAPVMPYEWFHGMSDRDALAVARYLKRLGPVSHVVRQRPSIAFKLAKFAFLRPAREVSVPSLPEAVSPEYGRYLAQHVALCADCHTPRKGMRSTTDRSRLFAGDAHPPKDLLANPSNLTPDSAFGVGAWSEADFLQTIRTGVNPKGDSLHSTMPWRALRGITDDDLRAIYLYLTTVKPIHHQVLRR